MTNVLTCITELNVDEPSAQALLAAIRDSQESVWRKAGLTTEVQPAFRKVMQYAAALGITAEDFCFGSQVTERQFEDWQKLPERCPVPSRIHALLSEDMPAILRRRIPSTA